MPGEAQKGQADWASKAAHAAPLMQNNDLRLRPCRYGVMLYSLNDMYIGRSLDLYGEYNEAEVKLYKQLVRPGQVVVDAGANIGSHTVFFARAVNPGGFVVAFEPQRVIFQILCANLAVNGLRNVDTRRAAVGAEPAVLKVPAVDFSRETNLGATKLVGQDAETAGEAVPVSTIDALGLNRCDLIKIDVEGMEREALLGASETIRRFKPALYLENNDRDRSPALIQTLFDLGYRPHWHLPHLFNPQNLRGEAENVFGATLNVNMLCLPRDDPRSVEMRPVESVDDWWRDAVEAGG